LGTVVWGEFLTTDKRERGDISHVWLKDDDEYGPYIFFDSESTKNRRPHRIPLSPLLVNLLRKRRDEGAERTLKEVEGFGRKGRLWVFPARNKYSATGHYQDGSYLLDAIASEVGIDVLNPHDLRRSMGAVMVALSVPDGIQSRLFNHTRATHRDDAAAAVTARYTQPEWALLREWAEKIQNYIFSAAPNVYNSLRPADWQPLPAQDPHVPTPPKSRTGRPRKTNVEESSVVEEGAR
jgi:integrase